MDLTTISEKVAAGLYRTVKEFVSDLRLVFTNCIDYWTLTVNYAILARYLLNEVDLRVKEMTFELTTGTQVVYSANEAAGGSKAKGAKKTGKQFKHPAVTAWTPAMQQAAAAVVTGGANKDSSTAPSTPSTPAPSTLEAAAADFPSSSSSSSSAMSAAEHSQCTSIVHSLLADSQYGLFAKPANIPDLAELLSDYYVKVSQPNDLLTVSRRLAIRDYATLDEFKENVALIWENALSYYSQPALKDKLLDADLIRTLAVKLKQDFNRRWDSYHTTTPNKLVIKKNSAAAPTVAPAAALTAATATTAQPASAAHGHSAQLKLEAGGAEAAPSTTTATTSSAAIGAPTQVKRESGAHSAKDSFLQASASIVGSAAPLSAAQHTAAGGADGTAAVAALPSSSSSLSPAPTLPFTAAATAGDKRVKKSPGSAALPLPATPSNAAIRPTSPTDSPSPAAPHRSAHASLAVSSMTSGPGTNRPLSSSTHPSAAVSSSRRSDASAGASLSSSTGSLHPSSISGSSWSSVLSDVLPAPPKAKQRGGSVIKPLTAAQRKVRVSGVSRQIGSSAVRIHHYWQQQQHTATAQQTADEATVSNPSSSSFLSTAGRAVVQQQLRSTVSSGTSNSTQLSLPTDLLSLASLAPLPPSASLPPSVGLSASAASSHPRSLSVLSVTAPAVPSEQSLLKRYLAAGFCRCGVGGLLLCRARHSLLPATVHFPYHIDAFTVDIAAVHSSPSCTAVVVPLHCQSFDRVGDCSVVMPSTARALERSAAVACTRKRRRTDDTASSFSASAPAAPPTDTATVAHPADSLSAFTRRLFPPLRWSDRQQLQLLLIQLRRAVESGDSAASPQHETEQSDAGPAMHEQIISMDDTAGELTAALISHSSIQAAYGPIAQLSERLNWLSSGLLFCQEQLSEGTSSSSMHRQPSHTTEQSSRRHYLSCDGASLLDVQQDLPAGPPLPFARLSLFCFAATVSLALPGFDPLVPSPLHADGCALLPQSVCNAWERQKADEMRRMQQLGAQRMQGVVRTTEREWRLWTEQDRAMRERLMLSVT